MKKTSFLASALLGFAPVVAIALSGCSGGSSGGLSTSTASLTAASTPVPGATATSVPTSQGVTLTSTLTLANGQSVVFTSQVTGAAIAGTLKVAVAGSTAGSTAIPTGTYSYAGTITTTGTFTSQGNFGSFGGFTLTGQLPTATKAGTYTLTVNGKTQTGVIPIPALPVSTSYNLVPSLTFANVAVGSNVISAPISSFNDLKGGGKLTTATTGTTKYQTVGLAGRSSGGGITRDLAIALVSKTGLNVNPFTVGQVIPLSSQGSQILFSQTILKGFSFAAGGWFTSAGTATIKAIGPNSITLDLNAHFEPIPSGGGKGSFDLKGTATGTGLTVISISG